MSHCESFRSTIWPSKTKSRLNGYKLSDLAMVGLTKNIQNKLFGQFFWRIFRALTRQLIAFRRLYMCRRPVLIGAALRGMTSYVDIICALVIIAQPQVACNVVCNAPVQSLRATEFIAPSSTSFPSKSPCRVLSAKISNGIHAFSPMILLQMAPKQGSGVYSLRHNLIN